MILALTAVLLLTILLAALLLRVRQGHPAEYLSSSYSSCGDLSIALREVCRGVLTPDRKQLFHLSEALVEDCKLSFGREPVLCLIKGAVGQNWVLRLFSKGLNKLSLRQRGPRWRKRHVRMAAAFVLIR